VTISAWPNCEAAASAKWRSCGAAESCCDWKIQMGSSAYQGVYCVTLAVQGGCVDGGVGIRPVIAEQIDQGDLRVAFSGHPSCGDESKSLGQCGLLYACVDDDFGDLDDVVGQCAVTDGVLCDELQECGCLEVVAALKQGVLVRQVWMFLEVKAQAICIAGVE
jgi:hypothetical protein